MASTTEQDSKPRLAIGGWQINGWMVLAAILVVSIIVLRVS